VGRVLCSGVPGIYNAIAEWDQRAYRHESEDFEVAERMGSLSFLAVLILGWNDEGRALKSILVRIHSRR
jgi:hypothetical protein